MHLIVDMAAVVPGCKGKLWLGGEAASTNPSILDLHDIQWVLPACKKPTVVESMAVTVLEIFDGTGLANGDLSLEAFLPVSDHVVDILLDSGKVLVSCKNGAHRSATLAVIIMMRLSGLSALEAANSVSTLRNIVDLRSVAPASMRRRRPIKPIDFLIEHQDQIREGARNLRLSKVLSPVAYKKWALEAGFEGRAHAPLPKARPGRTWFSSSEWEKVSERGHTTEGSSGHSSLESAAPASEHSGSGSGANKRLKLVPAHPERPPSWLATDQYGGYHHGSAGVGADELATKEQREAKLQTLVSDLESMNTALLNLLQPQAKVRPPAKACPWDTRNPRNIPERQAQPAFEGGVEGPGDGSAAAEAAAAEVKPAAEAAEPKDESATLAGRALGLVTRYELRINYIMTKENTRTCENAM